MSGAPEAAASLFGSPEDSDPFAIVIATNDAGSTGVNKSTDNLFPNDEANQSPFLDSLSHPGTITAGNLYVAQTTSNYQPATANANGAWSQPDVARQYTPVDSIAAAGGYGQPSYGTSFTGNVAPASQAPAYNPSRYQPTASAKPLAPHQSYNPDRYAPATPATVAPVNPHPYDYSRSDPATGPYGTSYITPAAPAAPAPAAPPKAPLNRPKVVNAYDPPFPTTSSRRIARQGSGSYAAYAAYPPAQPFPPPSPFYATNGFAAQQGSQTPPPPPSGPPRPASGAASHYAAPPAAQPHQRGPPPRTPSLSYGQPHGAPPSATIPETPDYGAPPPRSQSRGSAFSQYQFPPPPNPTLMNGAVTVEAMIPPSQAPLPSQLAPPTHSYLPPPPPRSVPPQASSGTSDSTGNGSALQQPYSQPPATKGYEQYLQDSVKPAFAAEELVSKSSQEAADNDVCNGDYDRQDLVDEAVFTGHAQPSATTQQPKEEQVTDEDFFNGQYGDSEGGQTRFTEEPKTHHSHNEHPSTESEGRVASPAPTPVVDYGYGTSPYELPPERETEEIENIIKATPASSTFSPPPGANSYLPSAAPPSLPRPANPYVPPATTTPWTDPYASATPPSDPYIPPASIGNVALPPAAKPYAPVAPVSKVSSPPPTNPYAPLAQSISKVSSPPPVNPYAPRASQQQPLNTYVPPPPAPPAPKNIFSPPPAGNLSIKPTPNPYAVPPVDSATLPAAKYDPYAPSRSNTLSVPSQGFGSPEQPTQTLSYVPSTFKSHLGSPAVFSSAYAPSPSLVGANDPLSRVSGRAPVFSFGFGGRFVACFHGGDDLSTGFDVALSSRNTTSIKVHTLNKLLPKTAMSESETEFPGPLFADPSTQSLVRSAASAQAKKAKVVQYLEARSNELRQGLGYLAPAERKVAEAKLVLVKLLKIMVENDGKLSGSASIDSAIRTALVPRLGTESSTGNFTVTADAQADAGAALYSGGVPNAGFEQPISVTSLRPSALNKIEELLMRGERKQAYVYALDQRLWAHAMVIASSIDKEAWKEVVNEFIQTELGSNEEHPPHSAHSVPSTGAQSGSVDSQGGHDSLRVAYRFYSGQGVAAVQELLPKQALSRPSGAALMPPPLGMTPRTPGFPAAALNLPTPESLSKWRETIAMMMTSPPTPETALTLTALGDQLMTYSWTEAAHVCYLLSPQTSLLGASGSPTARVTLVGSKPPHLSPLFVRNPDNFIFSEILEYGLSLVTAAKGQEAFSGLVHLQPYRLLHAAALAELGNIQEASRYCEAITASISKSSPFLTPTFIAQLGLLSDRLSGTSHSDKGSSWIGGKITKPSLDSIGGWLEGRFTKLVTGEGEDEPEKKNGNAEHKPFDGPFAHYSTISNGPSARSSPAPRNPQVNPNPYAPPQRTASAMATSSPYYQSYAPIDRASSAMDHVNHGKGRSSPAPPVPAFPSHLNMAGVNSSLSKYNSNPPHSKMSTSTTAESSTPSSRVASPSPQETPVQKHPTAAAGGGSWWDYSSGSNDDSGNGGASTPTATSFMKVDEPLSVDDSGDGFISLMDAPTVGLGAAPVPPPASSRKYEEEDEIEDLGFGNSKKRKGEEELEGGNEGNGDGPVKSAEKQERPAPKPVQKAPEQQPQSSGGGWLSKWWKGGSKEGTSSGPVKVSLGEENSFYYDKELKRWVNKKSGGDPAPAPAPPPPPSRAQTASPSRSAPMRPSPLGGGGAPPPPRAASAMGGMSPEVAPPPGRVRSNLVPSSAADGGLSATPPPGPPIGAGPPPPIGGSRPPSTVPPSPGFAPNSGPHSRPRSQAATKKNIRSRYVDVFQQEGGTS